MIFHGVVDIRLEDVPAPILESLKDAIARITTSAICGTDLHFISINFPDMQPGTILGRGGVGIVESLEVTYAISRSVIG